MLAQVPTGPLPAAAPPMTRRPPGNPEGWTGEVESFLKNLVGTYQNAKSYRDHGRVKLVQQSGRVTTTTEMPMELAFRRPNLLLLDAGQYTVASDGKTLFFAVPELSQYTADAAPAQLEKQHLLAGSVMGGADEGHPDLVDFLIRPNAYQLLRAQIVKVSWKPDAVVAGEPCRVLFYETTLGTKVTTFVDTNRMLLLKVEAETRPTPASRLGAPVMPTLPPTTVRYEVAPVELNTSLAAEIFRFNAPANFRRVAQIAPEGDPLSGGPDPAHGPETAAEGGHLLGQPAPPVSGVDLSGKSVAPADLLGKVVLLFFWSLDSGEHSLRAIPIVQEVADQFKDRSELLVLGVSGAEASPQITKQLLDRKKAAFRNLIDDGMKLRTDFQLGGAPTFVLIGTDGKVKWAKLGAPPSLKDDLVAEIGKCLGKAKP